MRKILATFCSSVLLSQISYASIVCDKMYLANDNENTSYSLICPSTETHSISLSGRLDVNYLGICMENGCVRDFNLSDAFSSMYARMNGFTELSDEQKAF